jgi:hypothetical protein
MIMSLRASKEDRAVGCRSGYLLPLYATQYFSVGNSYG